jgi:site-specific DNA recombinase
MPDPERAPLIRQAFEMYSTGLHTKQKVLETINAAGLRTTKDKPLSKQTFEQMLRNPVYAGWLIIDVWGERKRGDFEPLVSRELFDTIQALLSGKRVNVMPRLRSNPDFPLRHFVKCGCCGSPLTGSYAKGRSKRYPYYYCQSKNCKDAVRISKTDLERGFVNLLERMQPKPEYVKLFNAIVLDVWKEKQAQSFAMSVTLKHHIEDLNQRKDRLEETFIYEKAIDRETYERQLDKLNEQIMLAEMQERDAKLESYDVEAVLNFAGHVILNAARLWTEFSSEQKQRLQKVLFPQGITFADGNYKTAETSLFFKLLQESEGEKTGLATLTGIEPVHPP